MAKKVRHLRFAFGLVLAAVTIEPGFSSESFNIYLRNPGMTTRNLGRLSAAKLYSLSLSVPSPLTLGTSVVRVTIKDPHTLIAAKTLHVGDPDLYLFFRPITDGDVYLAADWKGPARAPLEIDVLCIPWSPKPGDAGRLEAEPNNTWRQANPIELGKTIFATADDAPYIAVGEEREIEVWDRAVDWYRLEIQDPRPLLVFFEIDILDRDNIPVDVSVYRLENGNIVAHEEGMDPVSAPHEVQALPGNKFTTRLLRQGTYFVRVAASHPAYSLRTHVYDPPPYSDPRLAVRAGMDYLAAAGDSWHANTPRRGGITDRVADYHAETSTCIACHPTHFTTRANLAAQANGYPIRMRKEIQFLTERLYNNPRPFYGFPEASWSRLISASANVLSRLASLLNYFEHNISGEQRPSMMKGVAEYLKLYYRDRTTLPPDETNGNTPIVSAYEVAFYSWMVFDEMFHRTGDVEYALYRDRVRNLLEQNRLTNMLDLCYQTIALSTIDREAYKKQISANGERILSLQRPGLKGNASPATVPLDYGFFVQRVMPVLGAKGPDGAACVYCHATHTIFRLNPPPKQGDYSEAQLRENYRSALKVVDPDNPENSLILRKPLSTAEVEGTLGTGTLAHGGGQRWNGADHPAYKTILDWIRGAKLTSNREP